MLLSTTNHTIEGYYAMSDLAKFRAQKDKYFKSSPDSPIPYAERASFEGLHYYPENQDLRLEVRIAEFATKEPIQMLTSTGDLQEYLRWGRFPLESEGRAAELTVYYAGWGGYFVPFVDATSGAETYGAGRYLELEEQDGGSFLADFNLAYNPY